MRLLIIFKIVTILVLYIATASASNTMSNTEDRFLTKEESKKYLRKEPLTQKVENREKYQSIYTLGVIVVLILLSIVAILKYKNRKRANNFIKTDIHSHLLPALDDGSQSTKESITLIRRLKALGYTKIITTPHIMSHRFPNSSQTIKESLKTLKQELKKEKIDIELEVASEYYFDDHFIELLEKKDILTFGDGYLLFELPRREVPKNLFEGIELMLRQGYKPVLAHPERYNYFHDNFMIYKRLKSIGVFFQLNLISLVGFYTDEVKEVGQKLVKSGLIDFLGSDAHKAMYLDALEEVFKSQDFKDIFEKNAILNERL